MAEGSIINSRIFERSEEGETLFEIYKDIGKSTGIIVQKALGYKPRKIY